MDNTVVSRLREIILDGDDRGMRPPNGPDDFGLTAPQAHGNIVAKPFTWPAPETIPPRQFLFGRHYIRKNIGATIGSGGRAKTTLGLIEAVSMACGRDLLIGESITPLRVWCINGEEDQDELDRRVSAIGQRYAITEQQCGGRLFVQSVRDKPIRLATMVGNTPTLIDIRGPVFAAPHASMTTPGHGMLT
jgi:AAA domain